ncbi:hypothetical protein [Spirosoma endbachense]|uniref:Uncharacterized protein n=1 Tax=Spirosoma endbachense TaxID=2666025 RepID=A0A6P1W3W1_9BACT|nr:hypothetical protein [Spirosoma endbachense]QHV99238.1 hypothetical protein GJR95_31365 [Spirosoma endbachense]
MKKLLFFWVLALPVLAQTPAPVQADFQIFRGDIYESKPLTLVPADTLQTLSVRYTYTKATTSQLVDPQPTITRTGLTVVLRFTSTATLPETGWYELSAGVGKTKFIGVVSVGKNGTAVTNADGTLLAKYLSQVAVIQDALPTKLNKSDTTSMLQPYAKAVNVYPKSQTYTQAEVTTILQGYYLRVTVANKTAAALAATGLQPKIITVTTDESDGNRTNKYIYDGDNQPLQYPLF